MALQSVLIVDDDDASNYLHKRIISRMGLLAVIEAVNNLMRMK